MNELIVMQNNGNLTENGGYLALNSKGEKVEITNKEQASHLDVLDYLNAIKGLSDKALCYELSRLSEKTASDFGFTSVAQLVQLQYSNLDANTISRYRRIGKLFIYRIFNENGTLTYGYREPIPESASITNLGEVLSLFNISKEKWASMDSWTDEEISDLINNFAEMYLIPKDNENDSKLHLCGTLKNLREEKAKILPPKEKKNSKKSEGTPKPENTPKPEEAEQRTPTDEAKTAIDTLSAYFAGNDKALKKLAELAKMITE